MLKNMMMLLIAIVGSASAALAMLCIFLAGWYVLLRFAGFRADWMDKYSEEKGKKQ